MGADTSESETDWSARDDAEYSENLRFAESLFRRRERGETFDSIAQDCGLSIASIRRWLERYQDALAGDLRRLVRGRSTGRPAVAEKLSQAAIDRLRRQRVKCGSTSLTLEHFADDPLCPAPIREAILSMRNPHAIPQSLRRACSVPPELEARYRGPVTYGHVAFKCRHDGKVDDPVTHETRDLMAGDIYISDDMSRNRYFWFKLSDPDVETRTNWRRSTAWRSAGRGSTQWTPRASGWASRSWVARGTPTPPRMC